MANIIQEILRLTVDDNTAAGLNTAKSNVKDLKANVNSMGASFKANALRISIAAATIAGAFVTVRKAFDLAEGFAKFQQNQVAFNSQVTALGANVTEVFDEIRLKSAGLIDKNALLQSANTALSLGLSVQSLGDMIDVSRAKARDMGITTAEAFEKLTVALARGSVLRLDDLGVIVNITEAQEAYAASIDTTVDKLTTQDKALAFNTEALRLGAKALERYDLSQKTLNERLQTFKADMADAKIEVGAFTLKVGAGLLALLQSFSGFVERLNTLSLVVRKPLGVISDFFGITENEAENFDKAIDRSFNKANKTMAKSVSNMRLALTSTKDLLAEQLAMLKRSKLKDEKEEEDGEDTKGVVRKEEAIQAELQRLRLANEEAVLFGFERELFMLDTKHEQTLEKLRAQGATEAEIRDAQRIQETQKAIAFEANSLKITQDAAKAEAKAVADRNKAIETFERNRLANAGNLANSLFQLTGKKNKELFEAHKGFAIGQAVVDTSRAVTAALANPPGPPFNFGIAALAAAQGALQVQKIASTSLGGGGGVTAAGAGLGGGGGGAAPTAPPVPVAPAPSESFVTIRVISEGPTEADFINKVTTEIVEDIGDGRTTVQTVK